MSSPPPDPALPSIGNGSGSDSDSTSSAVAATSISPVASSGFSLPCRPLLHGPGHQHAELGPQVMRDVLLAQHDLHDPAAVPKIDEDDPAVIAPPRNPAREPYLLAR